MCYCTLHMYKMSLVFLKKRHHVELCMHAAAEHENILVFCVLF